MPKFKKKPVEIEAIRWSGEETQIPEVFDFFGEELAALPSGDMVGHPGLGYMPAFGTLDIPTLEGTMTASPGDWIIKGVEGEFYPIKNKIFQQTYEQIDW